MFFNFDNKDAFDKEELLKARKNEDFGSNFEEAYKERLNEFDFFNSFKKEKVEYENLSIRINKNLKKEIEELAKELDTSVSKVIERALQIVMTFRNNSFKK